MFLVQNISLINVIILVILHQSANYKAPFLQGHASLPVVGATDFMDGKSGLVHAVLRPSKLGQV